ncbi:MAG: type I-C CRISPR-associated protein Cas8c/Csd1, partial [Lachnospiraceae bacterium]|nr:type I-C CRISPR-associated protein Cas8c/Csd1 [Lachnospiraceae bacterium]
ILNWQKHCKWRRTVRLEKSEERDKRVTCECTPSPRDMALAAFGSQRSGWLEADSKLIKGTVKRLLPCITREGVKIPPDLIKAAARRASMPQTMSDFVWYNDVFCVVCAMIRFNYEKGDRTMENFLNDNIDDRNVLFGRLLAVYDYMEQRAMFEYDENGRVKERRTTNAKRYWNAYSSRPAKTFKTIKQNLVVYEKKLSDFELMKFEDWTSEIMSHFAENEFNSRALSEMYLPGYYQQMEHMKKAFQKKEQ